jgi:coproporphyrinogen III oxidase-like Fe-S oxidoreductase
MRSRPVPDATLAAMAASGVNRVSLGVQSFIDREASLSGRLHTARKFSKTFAASAPPASKTSTSTCSPALPNRP